MRKAVPRVGALPLKKCKACGEVAGVAPVAAIPDTSPTWSALEVTDEQREYVNQIVQAGQQLLTLVNQALDMSQIESGSFVVDWKRVEPADEIEAAAAMWTAFAQKHEVHLTLDTDAARACTLYTDAARLRQVLDNLLSNAIKFNHAGGSVSVWTRRMEPFLRIGVTDTGPGIAAERHADLFQAFAQPGTEAGHVSGAGVGLALSQRITELLSGRIGLISDGHNGTTFWIDLPLVPDAPPPATI